MLRNLFVFGSVMLLSFAAFAQRAGVATTVQIAQEPVLRSQSLNVDRTFVLKAEGMNIVTVYGDLVDANDSITGVEMTCAAPPSLNTTTFTVVNYAVCSTDVMTVSAGGVVYTLTEATNWTAATSHAVTAASLAAALAAIPNTTVIYTTGSASITVRTPNVNLFVYTSDTNCATVANATTNKAHVVQDCSTLASGNCTSYKAKWTASNGTDQPLATAARKQWDWRVDTGGFPYVACTFHTSAGSAATVDLLTVHVTLSAE